MNQSQKNRKERERAHYNALAIHFQKQPSKEKWQKDAHLLQHELYISYEYFESLLKIHSPGKMVLDYGCGTGIHSISPIRYGAREVIGIDLSEESLSIASERARVAGVEGRAIFQIMDCENLEFPDNSFDLILDGGAFSSLDLEHAMPEITRVLKTDGMLIGIETLGHNPIFNLKRRLNVWRGTRTKWAADHIFTMRDLERARGFFDKIEARFFHLTALFAMPFRNLPGAKSILKICDKIDAILLHVPFLKKYAFKTVFIFSHPKK